MRPQALGKGYETYDILSQSSSPTAAATSLPKAVAKSDSTANVALDGAEPTILSEEETSFLAAQKGLRIWCFCAALLIISVLVCAHGDWFHRFFDWLAHFPTLTS